MTNREQINYKNKTNYLTIQSNKEKETRQIS